MGEIIAKKGLDTTRQDFKKKFDINSINLTRFFLVFFTAFLTLSGFAQNVKIIVGGVVKNDGDTVEICFNSTVNFNADTSGFNSPVYSWDFGSGSPSSSTSKQQNLTFGVSGIQQVSLLTSDASNSDSAWLFVMVRDSINAGSITPSTAQICYDTNTNLSLTNTSGGDSIYVYTWEQSLSGANLWSGDTGATNSRSYNTGLLLVSHDYRVRVTSGCGVEDTSSILMVDVASEFVSGTISGVDTICYNIPKVITSSGFTGGRLPYTYQWQNKSSSGSSWVNVGTNSASYQGTTLLTSDYRVNVTSSQGCGMVSSDTHLIHVNPLPEIVQIIGPQNVCANQNDVIYEVDSIYSDYAYFWTCTKGSFNGTQYKYKASVHWNNSPIETDSLKLKQTIRSTGCERIQSIIINITENYAPNKTNIIRKPGSNILICDDSTQNISYQWGYDIKSTKTAVAIPDSDLRYVQLPFSFDTTLHRYWVQTRLDYGSNESCNTLSYFNPPPDVLSNSEVNKTFIRIYPNPTQGVICIEISPEMELDQLRVFDLKGTLIDFTYDGYNKSIKISKHVPNGIYIISFLNESALITKKIILNR
jgi:hypothetical protein